MGLIYEKNAEDDKAFDYYTKSKKQYQLAKDKLKEQKINLDIYYLLSSDSLLHSKAKKYYDTFYQYAQKTQNDSLIAEALMANCYTLINNNPIESRNLLKKVLEISQRLNSNNFAERAYTNLGVLYNERLNNPDSAIYYLDESFKIIQKKNNPEDLIYYYTNKAGAYYYKNDIDKAIETLKKGIELPISQVKYHEVFYFLFELLLLPWKEHQL
jgi:tetratricopeptide (TPR) repeat protein